MKDREKFIQHLERASEIVSTWPAWEQELLGGIAHSPRKRKPKMVRAKFKVDEIRRTKYQQEMHTIVMSPVYGNNDPNHENTKFWNASPSGKLELGCVNMEAAKIFELGEEYYIDFTKAN